jgi:hypothetical protein
MTDELIDTGVLLSHGWQGKNKKENKIDFRQTFYEQMSKISDISVKKFDKKKQKR